MKQPAISSRTIWDGAGVGGDPMYAYSQFAIARPGTALIDNSSFSFWNSTEDGFPGYVNMYLAGDHDNNIFADGSYDAGVIIHEYTHGVTGRLGRDVYDTYQGRAMGEAWSDYVALEMTLPEGAPPQGSYFLGEYLFQSFGSGIRSRPYSTDLGINGLTFADYGRVTDIGLEEHFDGEIWFQALWEARANFIRMFGEKEGRRRVQINVIEGLKLQPPRASMIDARDAIVLANRVTFKAEGEQQLWEGFAKRGLGVLAQSKTGDSSYVVPSFEAPSNTRGPAISQLELCARRDCDCGHVRRQQHEPDSVGPTNHQQRRSRACHPAPARYCVRRIDPFSQRCLCCASR